MLKLNQQQLQALIISVLVHLCLFLLALSLPKVPMAPPTNQDVEIVYQNETKNPKQFAEDSTPDLDHAIKDLKDEVTRLSRVARRVVREQIAAKPGETQNRSGQNGMRPAKNMAKVAREELNRRQHDKSQNTPAEISQNDAPEISKRQNKAEEDIQVDPRYEPPSITAPMPGANVARETHLGDSTISDYIPEVKVGGFTSLNQDQFLFYTFYARINEQIRNRWVENIRSLINESPQSQLSKWAEKPQVSEFEVLLAPDGRYVRTILYRHAETQVIDNTAVSAIRLASPFINPPTEIVEPDGFIHLHYQFHLEFKPSLIASGAR